MRRWRRLLLKGQGLKGQEPKGQGLKGQRAEAGVAEVAESQDVEARSVEGEVVEVNEANSLKKIKQNINCCLYYIYFPHETFGTIHLRRQHDLGGRGVPMCRWSKGHST